MDTNTDLLNTAEHLIRARGFDAISYADLSRKVGIRKASIHHHFPTKADLARAVMARYRAHFAITLAAISADHHTTAGRINAYLDLYRDALCQGESVCLCVAMSAGRDSFDAATLDELALFHDDCLTWLSDAFAQSGAPETDAPATLALVEGAQLMARAARSVAPFDQATAALRHRFAPTGDPDESAP